MRVFHGLAGLPDFNAPVVTVGSFDGVHRGHRLLLDSAVGTAQQRTAESLAFTFSPHPRKFLKPQERTWLLTTLEEKLYLLAQSGISNTIVMPFDKGFSQMNYREFIERIIIGTLGALALVVGYDHKFGHNKEGEYSHILDSGIEIIRVPELVGDGLKISSTQARKAVSMGYMSKAADILGHPYIIKGDLSPLNGKRYKLSVSDPDKLLPPPGDYPVGIPGAVEAILSVSSDGLILYGAGWEIAQSENAVISFL